MIEYIFVAGIGYLSYNFFKKNKSKKFQNIQKPTIENYFKIENFQNVTPINLERTYKKKFDFKNLEDLRKINQEKGFLLNRGFPLTVEEIQTLLKMYYEGQSIEYLEKFFQRSRITISIQLKNNGVTLTEELKEIIKSSDIKKETKKKTNKQKNKSLDSVNQIPNEFELTKELQIAYETMENSKKNIFLTGKAGTGKSTLIEYFRKNTKKETVILAPTGIAAIKIKGKTIHSFFLLPPKIINSEEIEYLHGSHKEVINKVEVIIIDECSMIRADLLDSINTSLQKNRSNSKLFGGVQLILVGDLFQLPPVVTGDEIEAIDNLYPNGHYFFNASCLKNSDLYKIELTKIFRQKDDYFKDILNKLRISKISNEDLEIVNKSLNSSNTDYPKGTIIVSPTNNKVNQINEQNLSELPNKEFIFKAEINGKFIERPAEEFLKLKIGAQVMILINDVVKNSNYESRRYVNGTIAFISKISQESITVDIKGDLVEIPRNTWERFDYKISKGRIQSKVIASYKQYPLKLAWAVTIHKSQGQTFENVVVDLDRGSFAHGQTYVALSRAVSLDGLFLERKINHSDLIFDPKIFQYLGKKEQNKIEIEASKGNYLNRIKKIKSEYPNAYNKWEIWEDKKLIELYKKSIEIGDIAKIFGRQPSAIIGRIEKILDKKD
tara:strand:+ start:170 stop:2164 length:1995 start_codon:yes stop_codon:yes gene_type:complete